MAASSEPAMRAARRAWAVEPAAPSAIAPGSRVAGLPIRATAPCSWSVESSRGIRGPVVRAACWRPTESAAICCGPRVLWAQAK